MPMRRIEKILRGVVGYRKAFRNDLVKQYEQLRQNPDHHPKALLFTCMDARLFPMKMTQSEVGDVYVVRNAGNFVPHAVTYGGHPNWSEVSINPEPAALELCLARSGLPHVIVAGHSDCKAMHTVHEMLAHPEGVSDDSPLDLWLCRNSTKTVEKFQQRLKANEPIKFCSNSKGLQFEAHIDPDDKLSEADKLSQINTLQQLENIISHKVVRPLIEGKKVHMHALWLEIFAGEVHYFSHKSKKFIVINDDNIEQIIKEIPRNEPM